MKTIIKLSIITVFLFSFTGFICEDEVKKPLNSRIIKASRYNAAGELEAYSVYDYSQSGSDLTSLKSLYYDASGVLQEKSVFIYNTDTESITQTIYKGTPAVIFYSINSLPLEYNENKNIIKISNSYTFEYDDNSNIKKRNIYGDADILLLYSLYEYDADNYLIKRADYNASDELKWYYILEYEPSSNIPPLNFADYLLPDDFYVLYIYEYFNQAP